MKEEALGSSQGYMAHMKLMKELRERLGEMYHQVSYDEEIRWQIQKNGRRTKGKLRRHTMTLLKRRMKPIAQFV